MLTVLTYERPCQYLILFVSYTKPLQYLPARAWPRCARWRRPRCPLRPPAGGWPASHSRATDDCPTSPTSPPTPAPATPAAPASRASLSPAGVSTPASVCCCPTLGLPRLPSHPLSRHHPLPSLPGGLSCNSHAVNDINYIL